MLQLTLRRQGLATLLLALISFTPIITIAQEKDDEKQIDKYLYAVRFEVPSTTVITAAEYARIQALLDKYRGKIPPEIQSQFNVQGEAADGRPTLTETQEATLKSITKQFFNEMAIEGLDMQKMQGFKTDYQKKNIKPGDNPLDPKIGWKGNYEGIERAMMGGRTLMVMDVWKQTLIEFFNAHPEAVGVVYGQLDIGSWVKMKINGLSFAGDIDFSSLATDAATNRKLVDLFSKNLKSVSGLSMKKLDAPLTAHGQAEADVYIGEWGKGILGKIRANETAGNGEKGKRV